MAISGIKQGSLQYHCLAIQGSSIFQTSGLFIDSTGIEQKRNLLTILGLYTRTKRTLKALSDYVHTMPADFEDGEQCDGNKI